MLCYSLREAASDYLEIQSAPARVINLLKSVEKLSHLVTKYEDTLYSNYLGDEAMRLSIIDEQFKNGIFVPYVVEVSNILIETHFYYQFMKSPLAEDLQSREEILAENFSSLRGKTYLKEILRIIDTAICQQVILSGDLLLPYLLNETKRLARVERDDLKPADLIILDLIAKNSILRFNLSLYLVDRSS